MKRKIPVLSGAISIFLVLIISLAFASPVQAVGKKALLIGINKYEHLPYYSKTFQRWFKNLKGAVNDVNIMKERLINQFGFSEKDILVLTDSQAMRAAIVKAFNDWLIKGTKEGDIAFFHFSGHGTQVKDQNGDEDDGLDEALAAYDIVPQGARNVIEAGLIIDDELGVLFRRLQGRSVTAFIDACHSGTVTRSIGGVPVSTLELTPAYRPKFIAVDIRGAQTMGRNFSLDNIPTQDDVPPGQVFIFSSMQHQLSVEMTMPDGTSNGALTLGIVEGLKTKGNTTYNALHKYVWDFVKNRHRLEQSPQIAPKEGSILAKQVLTPMTETLPPPTQMVAAKPPAKPPVTEPKPPVKPQQLAQAQPLPSASQAPPATPGKVESSPSRPHIEVVPIPKPPRLPQSPSPAPPPVATPSPSASTPHAPQPPPEVQDEKVLVRIDAIKGISPDTVRTMERSLAALDCVKLTREDFFDRLIRGEVKKGVYYVRLVNRIGDATRIFPTGNLDALLKAIGSHLQNDYMLKQFARIHNPHPPFNINVWVTDQKRNNFMVGEKVEFNFHSEQDCYLLMFNKDAQGNLTILFPNEYHKDNFVIGGTVVRIPDKKMNFDLQFFEPAGEEMVKVIATKEPLRLSDIGIEDIRPYLTKEGFIVLGPTNSELTRRVKPVQRIQENLSSGKFVWSDAMVVIRSHKK